MNRSAPANGYNGHGPKRQYRRQVWNSFRDFIRLKTRLETRNAHALLMPSIEGDEIAIALSKGFCQENLHVVDRNPAIVAHLKRRFTAVNTYGVDLTQAAARIAAKPHRISVANLDLCGTFDTSSGVISAFLKSGCMSSEARIAVTGLRGRETTKTGVVRQFLSTGIKSPPEGQVLKAPATVGDIGRYWSLLIAITNGTNYTGRVVAANTYKSNAGSQTMLWFLFDLLSLDVLCQKVKTICESNFTQEERITALTQFGISFVNGKLAHGFQGITHDPNWRDLEIAHRIRRAAGELA